MYEPSLTTLRSPSLDTISSPSPSSTYSTYLYVLIFVIVLAFLGFNIFDYLAKCTQNIVDIFGPIFKKIFGTVGTVGNVGANVTKEVVNVSNTGVKTGSDIVANTVTGAINTLQTGTEVQEPTHPLTKTLHNAQEISEYIADDSSSSIQANKTAKSGWCFIGEDRGFRSCVEVGENDHCMSGSIFPSQEVCVNPSLRV
jgi:hypothetical protein